MAKGSAQAAADERVLDFIQLYLGYRASAQAGVPESHMVAGWAIARSLDNTFQEALAEFIAPYLDDPGAAVWLPLYRKVLVGAPSPERVDHYADWSEAFLLWARRNPKVWQDAWDSVKSKRKALQIHDVTQEDEPASQVRKLAAIPSISGMIRIRKWLEGATGQLGQPLSAVESVGADAQTVRGLTSKLNNVQTALEASVPMSEDHAHLQEQKAELNRQVKAVVDSSADSAAVLAAAVSSQTTSAVAAKARLNDEQVRAMLAEGNVLITAGAGAGKCLLGDTLVATNQDVRQIQHCQDVKAVRTVDDKTLDFRDGAGEWLDMGMSPVVSVTTRSGIKLTGTPEHPLLVWDGSPKWVELQSLTPGMEVLVRPGYAIGLGERQVDLEEAYLSGKTLYAREPDEIPSWLFRATNPEQVLFLQGVMDNEGFVQDNVVGWCSTSLPLAQQVQQLFLGLGVFGTILGKISKTDRQPFWTLEFSEGRAYDFAVRVGFRDLAKQEKIRDLVPDVVFNMLEYTADLDWSDAQLLTNLTKYQLDAIVSVVPQEAPAHVFDFHVPKTHSFIANGIVSHNTAVMAAKVAYHVLEQGMSPDQVLAVSFTRKAATELKERVEKLYGIQSDTISTTHTLAGNVLREFHPGARAVLAKTSPRNSDKLMRLAFAQIALSERGSSSGYGYGGRGGWRGRKAAYGAAGGNPYWKEPAGQWFNLGVTPADEDGKPIGRNALSAVVEVAQSHSETWQDIKAKSDQNPRNSLLRFGAAFYAAYEWLKENDPELSPYRDFNDWLGDAADLMENNPQALASMQRRFKVVLVDEAQDLNKQQQRLFNAIAAKAKVYAQIGDDRQCVSVDTLVETPDGQVRVDTLKAGDQILAWRNGAAVMQTVRHVVLSSWDHGYQIRTSSGRELLMSPNHKIWATPVESRPDQHLVYLMYRRDLGYRVGVTNHGRTVINPYGLRPHSERATRMWVLNVANSRAEALELETFYSLQYGVPTLVFEGEKRGLDQERINKVFAKFGSRGALLLADKSFAFDLPHWMASSYSKFGHQARTIRLTSHSKAGTQVTLEWSGDDLIDALQGVRQSVGNTKVVGSKRIRRWFGNYREALAFAQDIQSRTKANLCERLSLGSSLLTLLPAASLHVNQRVPVLNSDGGVHLEVIETIETLPGSFIDLDVDDASCFFGNGILSHNSIYKFRGAVPELFTSLPQKGFDTYNLTFNYRSGKNIVDAAEQLISHNGDRQIPKTCRANPSRVEDGLVEMIRPDSHEAGAVQVSEEIANSCSPDAGGSPANFGILVRNNAEADAYAIALMAKGIPFRSRTSYFDKPAVKALLSWCQLAVSKDPNVINAATLKAHMRPGFFLGDKFMEGLQQYCPRGKNYAEYIIEGGTAYMSGYNAKNIALYADEINKLQKFQGSASDLINAVLGVTGSKGISFRDALAEDVDPEELMEGTDKLEVSKEEIAEAATAPINPLIRMAQKFEDPEKWLAFVDRMVKANDKTLKKEEDATPAVRIDTVHSWKGLQAKHVYVVMAGGGVFPSNHAMNAEADGVNTALDEERRLAYVAITRGEDAVTVICPAKNYRNKDADVPMFVAEACVKPRNGFAQSVGKTANWTVALETAVDDFLGSSTDESSLEEIWGDVL